jgi:outer membrane protein insertion porin family
VKLWLQLIIIFSSFFAFSAEKYSVNLKDWPADIAEKITKAVPDIKRNDLDLESLNIILKKLDANFNFNRLKIVKHNSTNELSLVGEISAEVKEIKFIDLSDTTEPEALVLMGLNQSNILDEENLKSGTEKLMQFYRELGYRSAVVKYEVTSDSSISKTVRISVIKKEMTVLTDLDIEGLSIISLQKRIKKKLQRKFRAATVNQETINKVTAELRKQLSTNGYYLTQVPSPQIVFAANDLTARLVFKLKPSQRYYVEVINNRYYEHTYLEDEILKLETFQTRDSNIGAELAEKLKAFYVNQGFPHVNVPFYETKKGERIYLYLNVDEGPRATLSELSVVGQISKDQFFYKNKFFDLASAKVQEKIYIKEDIELAAKNLLIFLQNDGFVNAKITRLFVSTERENPARGVVVLQIEEGQQVKVSNINFVGVSPQNLIPLQKALGLSADQSFSLIQLEQSILNIKKFYNNLGYIDYHLKNEETDLITYIDNNSKAALTFKIKEGPKVEVQSILIEGNTRTKDKLILIELDFKPTDLLTPAKIEESILRLQRTGHFNSVEISTLEKDTEVALRTVIIKVVERDPGIQVLGLGFTDENKGTLHGYAGIAYRNFYGWGIGLSLRSELNYNFAEVRYLEQKHTLGFVLPYLFETRARFRTSATRSNTISDITINKVTEANTAVFSIEQDFSSHVTGIMSYTVSTFKDHGITNEDEIKYSYSSESIVIGSVGPTIDIDYRDNLFNPTKGSFTRFNLEYAAESLGTNNVDDFYRITGQTTFYFPYKETGIVFVQSLRGGYIQDIDPIKNEGIPFDKRGFSLGGRTTIRGFSSTEFFPSTQNELGASYRFNTSSAYELVKSEIRFPLVIKYDLAGALFYDGGRVQIEGLNLINGWRDAVGFGIRYNTPVGPLNLEYAQKLNKRAGESDGAFHLSIGIF